MTSAGRRAGVEDEATQQPSAAELADFGQTITSQLGHFQDGTRQQDLAGILRLRMRANGSMDYRDYKRLLENSAEWEALAPLLTVAETYFFRMPSHFEALADDVLPQVIRAREKDRTLRILSAGCATGEEAYTLRIVLNERFPELAEWEVAIVGVDLSLAALERARAGVYSTWSLRATSAARREANFTAEDKRFRLKPPARAGVSFRRENLLAAPPDEAKFDIIFCRNVLIYFTDEAIRTTLDRLTARLAPAGFLFLGPAESLRGISNDYQLCQGHDVFYYRLRQSAVTAAMRKPALAQAPASAPDGRVARPAALPEQSSDDLLGTDSWYASIEQSWQRLTALVPGPGKARQAHGEGPLRRIAAATPASTAGAASETAAEDALLALVAAERFAQALDLLATMSSDPVGARRRGLLRGSLLTNLGRYDEAERECKLLLAGDATDAGAHFLLGLCREQAGALGEAAKHMATATYLDPSFPMAHLHRGMIARRQKDEAGARASFRLALRAIEHEDAARLALFGGGFSRASLRLLCLRELGEADVDPPNDRPAAAKRSDVRRGG